MEHTLEHRRHLALARYLAGDKIEEICRDLHCAKSWLYKWKTRYQADNPAWTAGLSTQPRRKPRQTPPPIAQQVVTVYHTLVQSGQQGSAATIQHALTAQGITPLPSRRTIYRILQRHKAEKGL
jgi:transposase-like protein